VGGAIDGLGSLLEPVAGGFIEFNAKGGSSHGTSCVCAGENIAVWLNFDEDGATRCNLQVRNFNVSVTWLRLNKGHGGAGW
jgi:hypothetical protein